MSARPAIGTLRRGWEAAPELRQGAALTVALAVVGTAGRVAVPILVQQSIDTGFDADGVDVGRIVQLALVAVVVIVVGAGAMRAATARLAVRSERALYGLRTRVFAHVHDLDVAEHAEERRGALVSRVTSDVETLSQFFSWGGLAWLLDGTLIVVVGAIMVVFDWRLALVAFVVSAPLVPLLRAVQRRLVVAYGIERERNAELLAGVSEVVSGAGVIRAYRARARTSARVDAAIAAHREAGIRANTLAALLFPAGEVFGVLTVAAVIATGLLIGPEGGLTAGTMVGFVFLTYRFLEPIAEFTEILDQTQTAVAGLQRMLDVLGRPITVVDPPDGVDLPAGPPRVELQDVTFRYRARPGQGLDEAAPALRAVSVSIEPGTSVAVVGATGSGKTTLARLLTRLADPSEGSVRVSDVDLRDVRMRSLRSVLVMVPQEPFLFDTSIAENVRFGAPHASERDVELAFVELGLEGWVQSLDEGLDTKVGERGEHLSAGERQLVALARAYIANPSCLILDEATSSVDPQTEVRLARALSSLTRGRTSITIAHRLSTAVRAERVLVFDEGRLVEDGSHDELLARGGYYAALYASWLDATATATAAGAA